MGKKQPNIHLLDIEKARYKNRRISTEITVVGLGRYIAYD